MQLLPIQNYNPKWPEYFLQIRHSLLPIIKILNLGIEHVGSTSVPKLAAKNTIDIDLIYYQDHQFPKLVHHLSKLGYYHNGDQGITHREVFKRKTDTPHHPVLDNIHHHLYACPSYNIERILALARQEQNAAS